MANQRHVDILTRDGVEMWNLWRKEEPEIQPDLFGANLFGADLAEADLAEANLRRVNLRGANLRRVNLSGTYLSSADLSGANLHRANLFRAYLGWADLSGADLAEAHLGQANLFAANLVGTDLGGADLAEAHLGGANLSGANLRGADLRRADLSGAMCLKTTFSSATLTGCTVYGISAWDVNMEGATQADLRISPADQEATIRVDNLEVAQFLYLLLNNRNARNVLDTITSKVVLILGRFSDERKLVLDALREALRRHPNGYIPVLFDFEPQLDKPVLETVKTLANLARFVIADLTDPHMVRSELTYITANVPTVPVQPIIAGDADLPTEYASWTLYPWFRRVYRYNDLAHLLASLTEAVIMPVEGQVHARRLADTDSL